MVTFSYLIDALLRELVLHHRVQEAGKVSVEALVAADELWRENEHECTWNET
jgi:hypothetical protein